MIRRTVRARGRAPRAPHVEKQEAQAGFAIGVYPQHIIEDTARDRFDDVRHNSEFHREVLAANLMNESGEITQKGWDLLNEDVRRIEMNSMQWMRRKFRNARDEGHNDDELVGTFWFDPTNLDHAQLVELAADTGRQERIDMVDLSYGDLASTAFDGVSDFGASVLGGGITFFDVKPEDMEIVEQTIDRHRPKRQPQQATEPLQTTEEEDRRLPPGYNVNKLRKALEGLLDFTTSGRRYETRNPYTIPEVKAAIAALGRKK